MLFDVYKFWQKQDKNSYFKPRILHHIKCCYDKGDIVSNYEVNLNSSIEISNKK